MLTGFVFDAATGEDLGEFVNDWKPTYRYLNRFTIPSRWCLKMQWTQRQLTKFKALDGEEWLTKADGTITVNGAIVLRANTALYEGADDLVPDQRLRSVGPFDWDTMVVLTTWKFYRT